MIIVTPEFQKTVEDLIKNLQPEDFLDAEEFRLARQYHALPIGVDMWSYVLFTSDGEIIDQDFDGNFQHHKTDLQLLIRVLVAGTRRYPQLENFIPNRFDDSKICPVCKGVGVLESVRDPTTEKPGKCFICAGLGWITEEYYEQIIGNCEA